MEIGLEDGIKQYAGGLGILAGDTLKAAADSKYPMIGVTLLYKKGYFRQMLSENAEQLEIADEWDYTKFLENTGKLIDVPFYQSFAKAEIWVYKVKGFSGFEVPVIFLNFDLPQNRDSEKFISYNLYTNYSETRFRQEIGLGIGGVKALEALGYKVNKYHLNESHAAFAILEARKMTGSKELAKSKIVFTTHTPAEHGHIQYGKNFIEEIMAQEYSKLLLDDYEEDRIHLTKFCLENCSYANAVSQRHGQVSRKMFPEKNIHSITNGIHTRTWAAKATTEVLDKYLTGWKGDPSVLRGATAIPDEEIFNMHKKNKRELFEYIKAKNSIELDESKFSIGFARRVDGYKRSGFIFTDIEILKYLAEKFGGIYVFLSGKAYFDYGPAEDLIRQFIKHSKEDLGALKVIYLEDYGMQISQLMIQGCDIWLNNPKKPLEASGTSGMKAALNGVPSFSTIDGWWVEGWKEGVTGWSIGSEDMNQVQDTIELHDLYCKLEHTIMPTFYANQPEWIEIQKNAIAFNASYFNTDRMLREYIEQAYSVS